VENFSRRHKKQELGYPGLALLILIAILLTLPLFIIIYNHIPPIYVPFTENTRIDHILTFCVVFICVYYLARKIRYWLYLFFATAVFTMIITSLTSKYTFFHLYHDYSSFLYSLNRSAIEFQFASAGDAENNIFANATLFRQAIDYKNESVRNYAAQIAVMHFERYTTNANRRVIQFFSVFKEIRRRWRYVYDPVGADYFAKASETVSQLRSDGKFKGDCDDYSILMAACIKAVGGDVKLVRTTIHSSTGSIGHVYPEVLVGNLKDLENINYLIKQVLFPRENGDEPIYYHVDEENMVWLNFDYNDYYPGGKYQSTIRKAELKI
jgi:hypothetical protein